MQILSNINNTEAAILFNKMSGHKYVLKVDIGRLIFFKSYDINNSVDDIKKDLKLMTPQLLDEAVNHHQKMTLDEFISTYVISEDDDTDEIEKDYNNILNKNANVLDQSIFLFETEDEYLAEIEDFKSYDNEVWTVKFL